MSDLDQRVVPPLDNTNVLEIPSVSWLPGAPLPAELHTGHQAIDFEHGQLLASMQSLRNLCREFVYKKDCGGCHEEKRQSCENQLVALLGDLLAFILDHFKNEEVVMRDSLLLSLNREVCEAHMEDHANISAKIQEIIVSLEPMNTVGLLRELDVLLQRWIVNHVMLHDLMLGRWLESSGQQLHFGKS
jgi:hemerythrin-like metal-binding protein